MNKSNKILLGVLSFVVVCVIGYALFSDNITVTGTATAKGSFDIVASCQTGIDSRIGTATSLGWSKEEGYANDSCTVSGNKVSMTAEFLYPGAQRYFTVSFKNNGTIDAVFDIKKVTETEQICVSDDENGTNKRCASGRMLEGYLGNFGAKFTTSVTEKGVIFEDPSGNIITLQEAISSGLFDSANQKATLNVGYTLYIVHFGIITYDYNNPNTSNKMFVDVSNISSYTFEQATN